MKVMTKYLLKELAIAEDEIAKRAPNSHIAASVLELPSNPGNELRLHINFAVREFLSHGAGDEEIRRKTKMLLVSMQDYIARWAKSLDAEAANEEAAREALQ